jgi:hypothetical protein
MSKKEKMMAAEKKKQLHRLPAVATKRGGDRSGKRRTLGVRSDPEWNRTRSHLLRGNNIGIDTRGGVDERTEGGIGGHGEYTSVLDCPI